MMILLLKKDVVSVPAVRAGVHRLEDAVAAGQEQVFQVCDEGTGVHSVVLREGCEVILWSQ